MITILKLSTQLRRLIDKKLSDIITESKDYGGYRNFLRNTGSGTRNGVTHEYFDIGAGRSYLGYAGRGSSSILAIEAAYGYLGTVCLQELKFHG